MPNKKTKRLSKKRVVVRVGKFPTKEEDRIVELRQRASAVLLMTDFVERMLQWCAGAEGLGWMILRYFNAAGADPAGEIGEDHDAETHLIPLAIAAALGKSPLQVFGTDYPTPDGTAIRDYVHVTDLARAHVAALAHLAAKGSNAALNLGTGQGQSIREVIRCVESVSGRSVSHCEAPRREGDPPALIADATRAAELVGWRPQHSDLATIVETAWRWFERRS